MKRPTIPYFHRMANSSLALGMLALSMSILADEPEQTIPDPGFRPESEYAEIFLDAVGTAKIAVLPTLVRRSERTAHSFASQQQIVAFLNEHSIAAASTKPLRIDLGPVRRPSQWEIFQYGAGSVAAKLEAYETGADYTLVMELLVPDYQAVFGIDVYIVDTQGQSAFSFLLNSHHEMFSDAKLYAKNSSEESRDEMIANATRVGLMALQSQIEQARECIAAAAANKAVKAEAGLVHDFQSELASHTSSNGIPLGFSTFSDGTSPVSISRTDSNPPVPDEAKGNTVLKLSLDVTGWAGIIYLIRDDDADIWASQDWSSLDGFSFLLYGNKSGTEMFVDVIDNRSPCSQRDDAERYTYVFLDDVAGWRLISVPFKDMARKEIGNGAPNDGLNLVSVHGWGLGALNTGGSRVFYIDDFRLWHDPPDRQSEQDDVITHSTFVETRIDEHSSRLTIDTSHEDQLVVEKVMRLTCECAQLALDRGFRYYVIDEQTRLSGDRGSSRITFYITLPEGIPVGTQVVRESGAQEAHLVGAAVDAVEMTNICRFMQSESQNRGEP